MIISYTRNFAILAPWKTASSTIWVRLSSFNESPYSRFHDFNPFLNRVVNQHLTYADFMALPEGRLGLFTAAFVRNPYDRVYSGFRQLQKDIDLQRDSPYPQPWIKTLILKQLAENFASLCQANFDFDEWLARVDEHQIFEVGRNSNFPLHPAHYWTHANGRQMVDFVGRVENFEEDLRGLCARLNIEVSSTENDNVHTLQQQPVEVPYRSAHLMNPRSVARINELFRDDFELFGYERLK
jgi:hypothetical protein